MLLAIGIVIGLILGLTGAGGSMFAVPLLVLMARVSIIDASILEKHKLARLAFLFSQKDRLG